MGNESLRAAITRSGLTLAEFADIVAVDVKTVQRWLAGRTPYQRHRTKVAGALDTTEYELWPKTAPPPTQPDTREDTLYLPGDVIASYARASELTAPNPAELLRAADDCIEILTPCLPRQPEILEPLREHAAAGNRIRIIIENPDDEPVRLLGIDAIEIRASPTHHDHMLYRAGEQMLLLLTRIESTHLPPPLIHLQRLTDDGLFDRLARDFEYRWLEATPLTPPLQSTVDIDASQPERWSELDPAVSPEAAQTPASPPTPHAGEPRRWPGRRT